MKRYLSLLALILVFALSHFSGGAISAKAADETSSEKNVLEELDDKLTQLIDGLDFSTLEKYFDGLNGIFNESISIKDVVYKFVKGESVVEYSSVLKYLFSLFTRELKSKLPTVISLFSIILACSLLSCFDFRRLGGGVHDVVSFVGYTATVVTITGVVYSVVNSAKSAVEGLGAIVQAILPILLALSTATGASAEVALLSPTTLFLDGFITVFIGKIAFPCIALFLALSVVSNISKTIKLKGFIDFLSGFMKWSIGLGGTVFSLLVTLKGVGAGLADGVKLRTLKYALNSSIPLVGGIVSGSTDVLFAAVSLTKNALGLTAIVVILGVVLKPIVLVATQSLALKLVNAISQPFADDRTSAFVSSAVSVLNHVVAITIVCALVYVITMFSLIIATGYAF